MFVLSVPSICHSTAAAPIIFLFSSSFKIDFKITFFASYCLLIFRPFCSWQCRERIQELESYVVNSQPFLLFRVHGSNHVKFARYDRVYFKCGLKIKESMANESKVKAVLGALSSKLGRPRFSNYLFDPVYNGNKKIPT